MVLVVAAAVVLVFLFLAARANELFVLSVRDGKVLLVRGRIPAGLKHDLADALARQGVKRATVKAFRDQDGARLDVSGVDDFEAQRLRNIFRLYPVSLLRAAPDNDKRTLGQFLGIAWLAWLFDRNS